MTRIEPSDEDVERLFSFVGQYVVLFQQIETTLDEIIILSTLAGSVSETYRRTTYNTRCLLSQLSNRSRIECVRTIVLGSGVNSDVPDQRIWIEQFRELLRRIEKEAEFRNSLVHSRYLFDFGKVIHFQTRIKKGRLDTSLKSYSEDEQDNRIQAVAELVSDLNRAIVQLRHWSQLLCQPSNLTSQTE